MKTRFDSCAAGRTTRTDDLLPLINIVFLLLIFFMVAGQVQSTDPSMIEPFAEASGERPAGRLRIDLRADGTVLVDDARVQQTLADSLRQRTLDPALPVDVHVHRDLPASALDPVIELMRRRAVSQLHIVIRVES